MKKRSSFLFLGIIMLGIVMRAPFTAIPAILTDIAQSLNVGVSELGMLTSIPLLMFAFCSTLAPRLANRFGTEKLMAGVLLILAIGSFLRIFNLPSLYLGTVFIGGATAIINVLLPSIVARYYPDKIGFYTTVYVTIMGLAATLAAMVAVPIVAATSWQLFLLIISFVVFLAFIIWLPNTRGETIQTVQAKGSQMKQSPLFHNKAALAFLLFGGLQSMLFYTEITWLPTIAQTAGIGKTEAGLLIGVYSFISIPISMVIPEIVSRLSRPNRAKLMVSLSSLTFIGLFLMMIASENMMMWLFIHILLGTTTGALFPYMMLNFSLKTTSSHATAQLSGMVQSGGYLISAIGPVLLGYSYPLVGTWLPLIVALFLVTGVMIWTILYIESEETIL